MNTTEKNTKKNFNRIKNPEWWNAKNKAHSEHSVETKI